MNHEGHECDFQPSAPHYSLATALRHVMYLAGFALIAVKVVLPALQAIGGAL